MHAGSGSRGSGAQTQCSAVVGGGMVSTAGVASVSHVPFKLVCASIPVINENS